MLLSQFDIDSPLGRRFRASARKYGALPVLVGFLLFGIVVLVGDLRQCDVFRARVERDPIAVALADAATISLILIAAGPLAGPARLAAGGDDVR